jgi:hypothetical protein
MSFIAYFVIASLIVYTLIELKNWLDNNEQ